MQNVKQTHTQTSMHLKRFCAMLNIVHILLELLAQVLFVGQVDSFQLTSILKHLLLCYYFVFGVPSARYFFTPFFQIPNCYDVVIVFFFYFTSISCLFVRVLWTVAFTFGTEVHTLQQKLQNTQHRIRCSKSLGFFTGFFVRCYYTELLLVSGLIHSNEW